MIIVRPAVSFCWANARGLQASIYFLFILQEQLAMTRQVRQFHQQSENMYHYVNKSM